MKSFPSLCSVCFAGAALAVASTAIAAEEAEPTRPRNDPGWSLFEIGAGADLSTRRFGYSDALSKNARDYQVVAAPMPGGFIELYPGARSRVPVLQNLGLGASYANAPGLASRTSTGTDLVTSYDRLTFGVRARLPTGGPRAPVFGLDAGMVFTRFEITARGELAEEVPTVSYKSFRAGADGRLPIGRFAILMSGGFLLPFEAGETYDRFRGADVLGVDASIGVGVRLGAGFETRLRATVSHYFATFRPAAGDAYVAGGVLDDYFGPRLEVVYAY